MSANSLLVLQVLLYSFMHLLYIFAMMHCIAMKHLEAVSDWVLVTEPINNGGARSSTTFFFTMVFFVTSVWAANYPLLKRNIFKNLLKPYLFWRLVLRGWTFLVGDSLTCRVIAMNLLCSAWVLSWLNSTQIGFNTWLENGENSVSKWIYPLSDRHEPSAVFCVPNIIHTIQWVLQMSGKSGPSCWCVCIRCRIFLSHEKMVASGTRLGHELACERGQKFPFRTPPCPNWCSHPVTA